MPIAPHFGPTAVMTSGLQSTGMVPQFLPQGRGQIRQLTDLAAIRGFPQPVYMSMPTDVVRMVHNRPVLHHNQPGVPYFYQDPSYTGPQYSHQQLYYQHPPLYPGISNTDNNNCSSPIIQEIEDENDKQNQNSNVMDKDEICENIPEGSKNTENEVNSAEKKLPEEHATNKAFKDPTEAKNNGSVEQSQSNQHLATPQNLKESTLLKDCSRKDDFNSFIASMSETCKHKTSPNEASPPTAGSKTKPKKPRGNGGASIILHEAILNSPATQTCRNIEVDPESQRSSDTNEVAGKTGDEMNDLVSNIKEIDIKEGSRTRPIDGNDTIEKAETGGDGSASRETDNEGKVFGDASALGGKEKKQVTGTDLFTSTAKIDVGPIATDNGISNNEQSNTSHEEKPKSNSYSAFWQEAAHTEDGNDINVTGTPPDVLNVNKNGVAENSKEKHFSGEEKTESNCDPLQKRPTLDTNSSTNISHHTRETDQKEKNVQGEMEWDTSKGGNLPKPNKHAKVLFAY